MTRRTIALVALLTVTAGLVAGGVAVSRSAWDDGAWRRRTDNVRTDPSETLDRIDPAAARPAPPFAGPTRPIPALPPAVDRIGAVHDLLDGLIAGDTNRSYSALASADRAAVGTEASWEERVHALPHYLAYTVTGSDGGNVTTNVTIEPRLDEVVGYVPARAQVTWTTVAEDGGYRVSFSDSTTAPVLPSDDAARVAAQTWLTDQQQCRTGATYDGDLLGQPSLVGALCHAPGAFTAGTPLPLDRFRDPSLVLNALGADAPTFVRIVPVDGPTPFQIALAPLGETWEVIGVMEV